MDLLDTNVVSELRNVKTGRANPGVAQWDAQVDAGALSLSVISLHELELGIQLMECRDVPPRCNVAFVAGDPCGAGLDGPDPQPLRAGLIAATALEHGLTVVTGNTADFNQRRDHATFGTDPVGCWGKGADHQSDTNSCSLPTPFGAQRFVWLRLIQAPVTTG